MGSLDGALMQSDLLTQVYMLAALYSDAAERRRAAQAQGVADINGLFNDLKIRLEGRFELTKEQMACFLLSWLRVVWLTSNLKANIRKMANDMVYQGNRTSFVTMNIDLMASVYQICHSCLTNKTHLRNTRVKIAQTWASQTSLETLLVSRRFVQLSRRYAQVSVTPFDRMFVFLLTVHVHTC